jgi:hypothetical protein
VAQPPHSSAHVHVRSHFKAQANVGVGRVDPLHVEFLRLVDENRASQRSDRPIAMVLGEEISAYRAGNESGIKRAMIAQSWIP